MSHDPQQLLTALSTEAERLPHDRRCGLLAHEEQPDVRSERAELQRDVEAMHLRQVEIEQHQVRLQRLGLLNPLQPVRCLECLKFRLLERSADEPAERRMVLDDENPAGHGGSILDPVSGEIKNELAGRRRPPDVRR